MKEIYIAGKVNVGELTIAELALELESREHTVLCKWWERGLPKPYLDYPQENGLEAECMVAAAGDADVFILHPTDTILRAAVEFGAALESARHRMDKEVIVIDLPSVRQSVFYTHPAVIVLASIARIKRIR